MLIIIYNNNVSIGIFSKTTIMSNIFEKLVVNECYNCYVYM